VFRIQIRNKFVSWIRIRIKNAVQDPSACQLASVVDPEPQGAGTFGRTQYTEVSAPASAPAPGQTQVVNLIIIHIELGFKKVNFFVNILSKVMKNLLFI
jgi:hypothetical protein